MSFSKMAQNLLYFKTSPKSSPRQSLKLLSLQSFFMSVYLTTVTEWMVETAWIFLIVLTATRQILMECEMEEF